MHSAANRDRGTDPRPGPSVAVVLPVRNEAKHIGWCLTAVAAQSYQRGVMEIVLVDGASDDQTVAEAKRALADFPRFRVLQNPERTVPGSMNIGIAATDADIIVRVDGHTRIAPDYVERCVEALVRGDVDCVGGRQDPQGTSYFARATALAMSSPFGVGSAKFHFATEPCFVDTVFLGAYRRSTLNDLGGYDETLTRNQDDELNFRLTRSGGRVWLDPSIRSVYIPRSGPVRLWRQYFQYGQYKTVVRKKHGALPSLRHYVPSLFVTLQVLGLILGAALGIPEIPMACVGLYLVASAFAALAAAKHRILLVPGVILAFALMHVGYGSGFLVGLVKDPRQHSAT